MSNDIFATQIVKTSPQNGTGLQNPILQGGFPMTGGLGFLDLILTKTTEQTIKNSEKKPVTDNGLLQSDNAALQPKPTLSINDVLDRITQRLSDTTHAIDKTILPQDALSTNIADTGLTIDKTALLNAQTDKIPNILKSLGITQSNAAEQPELLKKLVQLMERLKNPQGGNPTGEWLTTNLTPNQVVTLEAGLQEMIQTIDTAIKSGQNTSQDLAALGLEIIQLLPPRPDSAVILLKAHNKNTTPDLNSPALPADKKFDGAGRLTPILNDTSSENLPAEKADRGNLHLMQDGESFEDMLQRLQAAKAGIGQNGAGKTDFPPAQPQAATAPQAAVQSGTILPPLSIIGPDGSLMSTSDIFDKIIQQFGLQPGSMSAGTSPSALTSPLTQSQTAAQAHPGTQIVAASIQKSAGTSESKSMRLRLDPPELGRVDIEMKFTKDKAAKIHILVEKPETHMMLQRDSQQLERALQNAGLDADSSDLSFELAQDEEQFSHDGKHDSQGPHGRGPDESDDEEIIESTMTWFVDPKTGHQRYDIWV